jgi:hypothetical protein
VVVQDVGETISVLARFMVSRFEPMRFEWQGRLHRVRRITGRWAEHDGQYRIYHFALVSDTDSFYEVSLHTRHMHWVLDRFMAGEPG